MIKHLYYLLNNDLSSLTNTFLDTDFASVGITADNITKRVANGFLDVLRVQMINAPTLYTTKEDFFNYLHYYVRMYSLQLYEKAKMVENLQTEYLKQNGTDERTITNSGRDSSNGTNNNTNFRKYADTPTNVAATSEFVDNYTSEQEKKTDNGSNSNTINYGKEITDSNSKGATFSQYLNNIDRLNRTLYNDIEKLITEKLMYQLLYDIDNN